MASSLARLSSLKYHPPLSAPLSRKLTAYLPSRRFATAFPRPPPPPTQQPVVETFSGSARSKKLALARNHKRPHTTSNMQGSTAEPPLRTRPEVVETFADTSKPRPYYAKHPPTRELPVLKKRWPFLLACVTLGVVGWAAFMLLVTNQEKISSSVVRQIMRNVREDDKLREALGDAIRPQPVWWLNGDPMINGKISQLQGNVDVSFRIKGSEGAGTLYFTSIRREKGAPFTILRFKVICDDGTIIHVDPKPV